MLLLRVCDVTSVPYQDFAVAASYTTDYLHHTWPFGHTWSLSMQEQFYVLWPLALIVLGGRRGLWFAAALLVVAPLSRTLVFGSTVVPNARLDAYADSLAMGCLFAGVRDRLLRWPWLGRIMASSWTIVTAVGVAVCIQWMDRRPSVMPPWFLNLFLYSVQNLMVIVIIHWAMLNPGLGVGRFLNSRVMTFIGAISYSIYIWQQPFLNPYSHALVTTFPLNLLCIAACALASYYLVELPAFALRRRLEAKVSRAPAPVPAVPGAAPARRRTLVGG